MVTDIRDAVDRERGTLDRRIFVDPAIYQEELERVFGRMWLWVGHDSLVPNPNDFFLTYMGEDPVILCRTASGQLKAFLNMCRHRGNRIVRADDGNAKNFMCAYHGWTYSNEGRLVSVPGLQEAYYGELDVDSLGLVEVAHLDTYAGFVFATWAPDAPSLEDYLGDMRWYMDILFNRRDGGVELLGPDKWVIPTNWKNPADNFIGDRYHAGVSHRSATLARMTVLKERTGEDRPMPKNSWEQPGNQVHAALGHGCAAVLLEDEQDRERAQRQAVGDPKLHEYAQSIRSEMEQRLGSLRARRVNPGHSGVFPNMSWLNGNTTVRMWHPRGPFQTEVWSFVAIDRAAPPEVKDLFRRYTMSQFGPSGLFEQDDMDNWSNSTTAGRSTVARKSLNIVSMGAGHEGPHPVLPGVVAVEKNCSEVNQRWFYARWAEVMAATDWGQIAVAPRTARYEGTATFKG